MGNRPASSNPRKGSSVLLEQELKVVNIFFDGTKNNLYNTDTFKGLSAAKKQKHREDETSYANAYSNVAWLFKEGNKDNEQTWIYIEGIGTRKGDTNDEVLGAAFGDGITGIKERAKEVFGKIQTALGSQPAHLHINAFGFSRGAATARHFVHLAKSNPKLFKGWNLSKSQIRFKFVGIFDTVSSYHDVKASTNILSALIEAGKAINHNFENDVEELKLDFRDLDNNDKKITKVFHIIAADEYRKNFSVTNINSAVNGGFGYEVTINGAHADVGGAYPDNTFGIPFDIEKDDPTLKNWLIEQRFYQADEINAVYRVANRAQVKVLQYYRAQRKTPVYNDIHKISLSMMAQMAIAFGKMSFTTKLSGYYVNLRPEIKTIMGHLPNRAVGVVKFGSRKDLSLSENQATKQFRHSYIHWSAKYIKGTATKDLGFEVRRQGDKGVPIRKTIPG